MNSSGDLTNAKIVLHRDDQLHDRFAGTVPDDGRPRMEPLRLVMNFNIPSLSSSQIARSSRSIGHWATTTSFAFDERDAVRLGGCAQYGKRLFARLSHRVAKAVSPNDAPDSRLHPPDSNQFA